jgi:hypothetical protein
LTSFRNILSVLFLLLACLSCQNRKEPIAQLQEQLSRDSATLSQIQERYPENIRSNFKWCDSMLFYVPKEQVPEYFETLNLAQAYLAQYDEMLPVMQHDISYTRQQLTNLKNDIDTHYISDSLAAVYLADEAAVADTLHNRILYFQDRLSNQDKALKTLRKTISKVASK